MRALNKGITKWCAFYKDINHDTRDCSYLKKEIEELLSRGNLGDLMGDSNRRNEVRKNRNFP